MGIIELFNISFIMALSGALMPGPLLTVTIGESAKRGFIAGPLLMLGHAILELVLVIALSAGLVSYLSINLVSQIIAVLGGVFLLYMGYGMIKDSLTGGVKLDLSHPQDGDNNEASNSSDKGWGLAASGALVSLSNPYWTIWWLTAGLSNITMALKGGMGGVAAFYTGHISADVVWYCLIAGAVAGGRRFISDKIYRGIIVVCGLFLLGLGAYFLYQGIFVGKLG
ncbi:MAG: LysE family transporter [Candidatus Saccharibacteria bacterium]